MDEYRGGCSGTYGRQTGEAVKERNVGQTEKGWRDQRGAGHRVWPSPHGQWAALKPQDRLPSRGVYRKEGEDIRDAVEAKCQHAGRKQTGLNKMREGAEKGPTKDTVTVLAAFPQTSVGTW